jgi:DNA adenine methylase
MGDLLRAPFPYPGNKSDVADVVWRGFGYVPNYCEPFFGAGGVLLRRPGGAGKIETVNDASGMLVNFWRGVQAAPEAVAAYCDWPVSECDMHARHQFLIGQMPSVRSQLLQDPYWFDAKLAGWWVWGMCAWIGGGWCSEIRAFSRKRPQLCDGPSGVHLPSIGNDRGINGVSAPPALEWFKRLQARLRNVRIASGDFERVLGPSVLGKGNNVGGRRPCAVFLDPPYNQSMRTEGLYAIDEKGVSDRAREWALVHGDDPELRICLAGYWAEHGDKMPENWQVHRWVGSKGYASSDNENRKQETLWFSPHCCAIDSQQQLKFGGVI